MCYYVSKLHGHSQIFQLIHQKIHANIQKCSMFRLFCKIIFSEIIPSKTATENKVPPKPQYKILVNFELNFSC